MKTTRLAKTMLLVLVLGAFGLPLGRAQGQTPVVTFPSTVCAIYKFQNNHRDPIWPQDVMVKGPAGDTFYSTTQAGGKYDVGTVFKVTSTGQLAVLYDFNTQSNGPFGPLGGLTVDMDGTLYGTTPSGGKWATGTLFRITQTGQLTVLWDFENGWRDVRHKPTPQQALDAAGGYPNMPPVLASDGNLYGVTSTSGNATTGVLYTVLGKTGQFKALSIFNGDAGFGPTSLIQGRDGNLYGTTNGGPAGTRYGAIFKATIPDGKISLVYAFDPQVGVNPHNVIEGSEPSGDYLYGTANGGSFRGVAFKLKLPAGAGIAPTILHKFYGPDGCTAVHSLLESVQSPYNDKYLYGVTPNGGPSCTSPGTIYRMLTDGSDFSVVHNFVGPEGGYPQTPLVAGTDGTVLYGLTPKGGNFLGAAYSLSHTVRLAGGPMQFEAGTTAYKDDLLEVKTNVIGYQGAAPKITGDRETGITINVKDPTAKFVQFLYREIVQHSSASGHPTLKAGVVNQVTVGPNAGIGEWSASTTYKAGVSVQSGGNFYLSISNGNLGHAPSLTSRYWVVIDADGCARMIHACYPLTTDDSDPQWLPDAELPNPAFPDANKDPYYADFDTRYDCDQATLFDSPTFEPPVAGSTDIQRFVGATFVIIGAKVIAKVQWVLDRPPVTAPGQPTETFHDIGVTRLNLAALPDPFRGRLVTKGFNSVP